jgi:hypothetical protein
LAFSTADKRRFTLKNADGGKCEDRENVEDSKDGLAYSAYLAVHTKVTPSSSLPPSHQIVPDHKDQRNQRSQQL